MSSPSRIKYFARDWCGHCQKFSDTWETIQSLAGSSNKKTFVTDKKGFSPVGYYPSFTVAGNAELGKEFGRIMRNYEKPLQERIQEAIEGSTDAGYTAALELLRQVPDKKVQKPKQPKKKTAASIGDFIDNTSSYKYSYGYRSY